MSSYTDAIASKGTYLSGRRTRIYGIIGLLVLLLLTIGIATSIGSVSIPLSTTFGILADRLPFVDIAHTWESTIETIVIDIRLPRVILAD